MTTSTGQSTTIHHGRNIKRFRELFGLKQEALAIELGSDWSQKKVSRLEENEVVEEAILEQIAGVLGIPKEAIKRFTEEVAINIISNTFNDDAAAYNVNYKCTINPLDKLVEMADENKKLYEELLKSEREKVALLQQMLELKK